MNKPENHSVFPMGTELPEQLAYSSQRWSNSVGDRWTWLVPDME